MITALAATSIVPLAAAKPNFILLMADDIGWGDLSYNAGRAHNPGAGNESYVVALPGRPSSTRWPMVPTLSSSGSTQPVPSARPLEPRPPRGAPPPRHISTAEGCAGSAWSCPDNLPLSPRVDHRRGRQGAGYATIHIGKWHLGLFPRATKHDRPTERWPTSSPRCTASTSGTRPRRRRRRRCAIAPRCSWATSPAASRARRGTWCVTGGGDFVSTPMASPTTGRRPTSTRGVRADATALRAAPNAAADAAWPTDVQDCRR